ncbi:hypothetical protein WJ97_14030 [Burkholderia ubonensis]|uniref:RNA ligase n=1 Tax=Burkholderia ubonensis TaxID=101571 RepID=UPI000770D22A|nr:RNA ligase [Burkholderia ubonensis]KVP96935.1 hypothetical protein WJ97_14030 [Burkholderia ubonensis]
MTAIQQEMRRLHGAAPQAIAAHFFENFGVVAERHLDGRLWLFDYDQLAAHKHRTTDVVIESRGLILCADTLDILRRPFARFFNIGEAPTYEADVDYARLEALEKADGSLVPLYFNRVTGHWHFGTRGTPFADAKHRQGGVFYERVLRAAGLDAVPGTPEFDAKVGFLSPDVTYLFELIGPANPHVTPYEKDELVLLGARRVTGEEFTPAQVSHLLGVLVAMNWNVRLPRRYAIPLQLKGLARSVQVEAIKQWVATAPEFKGLHEGVVCYDPATGKRLKVKTPLYCAVHLQGEELDGLSISPSRVADLIVAGDAEEFCLYFPALAPKVRAMAGQVQAFIDGLAPIWEEVKGIEDQKAFAIAVQAKAPGAASGIFFQARKTGLPPALTWMELPLNKKASLAAKLVN